ncbi:MAG TPA: hypothetical protein VLE02_02750 [Nitrosarchaeum sp.]|nr:hypothetical protein [Nitrosarchaeum sp.]
MSSRICFEYGFACPHYDCKFKSKKYDSVEAVNMHISKIHDKNLRLEHLLLKNGRLRLILRRK